MPPLHNHTLSASRCLHTCPARSTVSLCCADIPTAPHSRPFRLTNLRTAILSLSLLQCTAQCSDVHTWFRKIPATENLKKKTHTHSQTHNTHTDTHIHTHTHTHHTHPTHTPHTPTHRHTHTSTYSTAVCPYCTRCSVLRL